MVTEMLKVLPLLIVALPFSALAQAAGPETGRYQITASNCPDDKKCVAFGIDTVTGEVFACEYRFEPGLYDFGGQCKGLPMRESGRISASR